MFFLTTEEYRKELQTLDKDIDRLFAGDFNASSKIKNVYAGTFRVEQANQITRSLLDLLNESSVAPISPAGTRYLIIAETGIWPSSEDWFLYYSLRGSQGDRRRISDAPGHLFLPHETAAFQTFLGLSLRSGWGGVICGNCDNVSASFDHDGAIAVALHNADEDFEAKLARSKLTLTRVL